MEVKPFFCTCLLEDCKKVITVKHSWIDIEITHEILNFGQKTWKECKVFYSPDEKKNADFALRSSLEFDGTKDACYKAYLLKSHGKIKKIH